MILSTDKYFQTSAGNRITQKGITEQSHSIKMGGKCTVMDGAVIRGDLAAVNLGKLTVVGNNVTLRPSPKRIGAPCQPLVVGEHTLIGDNSVVDAISIGSFVHIGKNVVINQRCVLCDGCYIADNSVLPAGMSVPTLTVAAGAPARIVDELPESFLELQAHRLDEFYRSLDPRTGELAFPVPSIEAMLGGQLPMSPVPVPCLPDAAIAAPRPSDPSVGQHHGPPSQPSVGCIVAQRIAQWTAIQQADDRPAAYSAGSTPAGQ